MQDFGGHSNGFKLLEGADADIHSPYLSLLCGADELSVSSSRATPFSWSWEQNF